MAMQPSRIATSFIPVFIVLFFGCSTDFNHSQLKFYDSTTKKSYDLDKVQTGEYINKPISLFLQNDIISKYKESVFETEPPGVLQGVILVYTHDITVRLRPSTFNYVKRFDTLMKWDLNLCAKEKLGKVEFYCKDKLVK